ncbi:CmpA/NrtA family ABC transporter substrate-binding protein [Tatumella terrea]|uniref:CmpA/NrtA family ABC transporter substrate-binding protein n=1 Tax=Tatumella terrea TaxID=419007 RepID=UPI0031DE2BAE
MSQQPKPDRAFSRRALLQGAAALTGSLLLPGLMNSVYAAGSDAPELTTLRVGFIPLTDCASVVMAAAKGFDKKYGIRIVPEKQASWATVRDKILSGELDAAHILYGELYGLHMGLAGPATPMACLMTLNQNGQGITLSNQLRDAGITDLTALQRHMTTRPPGTYTFAQTFPTGNHAMWLYYWLASAGIHPLQKIRSLVVPPPQMVVNMKIGNMQGCCVGEPWNQRAISENIGFTAATSQHIWPDHPEKILGTRADWVNAHPHTARALTAAILEAARWIDASDDNRRETARVIAGRAVINTNVNIITGRMLGQYENGLGQRWQDAHAMRFYRDGEVSYPWLSDGMWFLTQHRRWGLLKTDPDYLAVAQQINRIDIYKQAAAAAGNVPLPASDMRSSVLMDGKRWDGSDPVGYLNSFSVKQ